MIWILRLLFAGFLSREGDFRKSVFQREPLAKLDFRGKGGLCGGHTLTERAGGCSYTRGNVSENEKGRSEMRLVDILAVFGNRGLQKVVKVKSEGGAELAVIKQSAKQQGEILVGYGNAKVIRWQVGDFSTRYILLEVTVDADNIDPEKGIKRITLRDLLATFGRSDFVKYVNFRDREEQIVTGVRFGAEDRLDEYFLCDDEVVVVWSVDECDMKEKGHIILSVLLNS